MIGDSLTDMEAGQRFGMKTLLIQEEFSLLQATELYLSLR